MKRRSKYDNMKEALRTALANASDRLPVWLRKSNTPYLTRKAVFQRAHDEVKKERGL